MLQLDDRGDRDSQPDPQWSDVWAQWPRNKFDRYFAEVATWGPLSREQVSALLQCIPPPPGGWLDSNTCLSGAHAALSRWDSEVNRGIAPANPTPDYLAAWGEEMNVELPEAFVESVQSRVAARLETRVRQATAKIALPAWAAALDSGADVPSETANRPKRGRPRTAEVHLSELLRRATDLLLEKAKLGRVLTLKEISKVMLQQPNSRWHDADTVKRLLSGRLPIEQAKVIAARARASSKSSLVSRRKAQ